MRLFAPIRSVKVAAALLSFAALLALALSSLAQSASNQAPFNRRAQRPGNFRANQMHPGDHLAEWMSRHSNLTLEQQQKALEAEPGFSSLPPVTQQHMHEQLARLYAMTPEERQRLLERNEWMEHLTVPQRRQVDAATAQLAQLPPDQRRYVARTFRGLRELPPNQRQAVLNSERFSHLTDAQRSTLNSLMAVEPLLPPPYDGDPKARPVPAPPPQ